MAFAAVESRRSTESRSFMVPQWYLRHHEAVMTKANSVGRLRFFGPMHIIWVTMTLGGVVSNSYYIEELRDKLSVLKHDAEFLYRYGALSGSVDFFGKLPPENQRVLLYLALTEGDEDVRNVAHVLMGPVLSSAEELLRQMSAYNRDQLEEARKSGQSKQGLVAKLDVERATNELRKACNRIGSLAIEEAFWILLPCDPAEKALWIEAAGATGRVPDGFRTSSYVPYEPTRDEKHRLLVSMQKAAWVLHVHNHPDMQGYVVHCAPSSSDMAFALQWKSTCIDLADKMRFFVIKGQSVCEYSLPQGTVSLWRICDSAETTVVADSTRTPAEVAQERQSDLLQADESGHPPQKWREPQCDAPHHLDASTILSLVGWLLLALVIIYGLLRSL